MRKSLIFMASSLLLTVLPAHAQLGLGLVPMRAELKMAPGQVYSGSLKLSNESGQKTRVRSEVLDFNVGDKTTPQFERDLPEEAAVSCKKWLSLNPMEIEMEKSGFMNVRYTFRLPADLPEGSYECAAGFTTLPTATQDNPGMAMRMAVRIVTAFYIVIGAPPVHGTIKGLKLETEPALPPPPKGKDDAEEPMTSAPAWQVVVVMENQGKMYYRPTGKVELLDAQGKTIETVDLPSLPVLREREQRFVLPLKTALDPGGHYLLRARVDIGTGAILEGSLDVGPAGQ